MKTYFIYFLATVLSVMLLASIPETASAQLTPKQQKQLAKEKDKEYKKKIKEYKKEGWKIAGNSKTIEVSLLEHYAKLSESSENKEIVGEVSQCRSINVCKQSALNNAQNEYARLVSGKIQGAFGSIIRANANRPQEEIDKMAGGFLNEIQAEVSGVLIPSYSIVKGTGNTNAFRSFFIVDTGKAASMVENVLERSIKETKLTIEEAKSISKFVQEELNKEE